jgi:hypothetical protein
MAATSSQYNYVTIGELEDRMATVFYSRDALVSKYTDGESPANDVFTASNVWSWITKAERIVIGYMRKTYNCFESDGTTPLDADAINAIVPANVKAVVMELAEQEAVNKIIRFKFIRDEKKRLYLDEYNMVLLDAVMDAEKLNSSRTEVGSVEDYNLEQSF